MIFAERMPRKMTDAERQRTMDFILNAQARFHVDMEVMKESQARLQEALTQMQESQAKMQESQAQMQESQTDALKRLDRLERMFKIGIKIYRRDRRETREKITALTDAIIRSEDSTNRFKDEMREFKEETRENLRMLTETVTMLANVVSGNGNASK